MSSSDIRRSLEGEECFVATPDGVRVAVQEWGPKNGPEIVLIHGLAQCHLTFIRQVTGDLADKFRIIAYDLRGHGSSDKPFDVECYRSNHRWADELHAVLEAKHLRRPVLVGWSLGGRVVRQYLMTYGDDRLGGINFVSTRPIEDPAIVGPGSKAIQGVADLGLADRLSAEIAFLRDCYARQPDEDFFRMAIAFNFIVPPQIRDAIGGWSTDAEASRRALAAVKVPTLISHGMADRLIKPGAAEMTRDAIPHATLSWYADCGHTPFFEDPDRFNSELASFVDAASRS